MSTPYYAAPEQKITVKSSWIALMLTILQFVYIGASVLIVLLSILNVVSPSTYADFELANGVLVIVTLLVFLGLLVTFGIWGYVLHGDLKLLFGKYPITPGSAVAQLLVPFYNLWGIWNVFSTLADHLKSKGGDLAEFGSDLRFWLPLLYVITVLARLMDRIVTIQSSHSEDVASPKLLLVSTGIDMILPFIWLMMTRTIGKAVDRLAKQKQSELSNQTIAGVQNA